MSPTPQVRRDRRILLIVALVAVAISLLASFTAYQINNQRIDDVHSLTRQNCRRENDTRMKLRNYFTFLEKVTRQIKTLTPVQINQRVKFYEQSKKFFSNDSC